MLNHPALLSLEPRIGLRVQSSSLAMKLVRKGAQVGDSSRHCVDQMPGGGRDSLTKKRQLSLRVCAPDYPLAFVLK